MTIIKENLKGYSTKALKAMFGNNSKIKISVPKKPEGKYNKEFYKKARIGRKKKEKVPIKNKKDNWQKLLKRRSNA